MIIRQETERLIHLSKTFRSVAVVGPRQSGKTTLCRAVFPKKPYVSLENPDVLEFATTDPRGFLSQYNNENGAILDEIQKAPQLFSYLQQILDETKTKGLFILKAKYSTIFYRKKPKELTTSAFSGYCLTWDHYSIRSIFITLLTSSVLILQ